MENLKSGLAILATFMCLFTSALAEKQAHAWEQKIIQAITTELANSGTPSLQIAIGKNDRLVFTSTLGLADIENDVIATNISRYRIGSVSKWFTSSAAKALIAEGTLDPEVDIQTYCPQFPEKEWPITTTHLLTHKSGIRHYTDYEAELENAKSAQEKERISRNRDRDRLSSYTRYSDVVTPLESFKNDPLLFEPGTNWLYSSYGYRVLACVLEGAAKKNYSELIDELIFKKATMSNTVKDDAWELITNRTTGYRLNRDKSLRKADLRDTSENLPAGGHLSTASDLALFALALNSGKLTPSSGGSTQQNWDVSKSTSVGLESSWQNAIPSEEFYGVGEMILPDKTRLWVGHTGRIAGGSAIVILQPESSLSIAVTTNAKGWNGYISFTDQLKLILEESSDLFK